MIKILIIKPDSSQLRPVIEAMKNDSFFDFSKNVDFFYEKDEKLSKDEIAKYNIILCESNPSIITLKKFKKNKNQVIIQLTHGIWIKKINNYLKKTKQIDYILSANEYSTALYKKIGYKSNQILKFGYPRIESYSKRNVNEIQEVVRKRIPKIDEYERIILFAPSWIHSIKKANLNYNLSWLEKELNKNDLLIICNHFLTNNSKLKVNYIFKKNIDIFNWIWHPTIKGEDLMLISDKVFTDYSSIIYDWEEMRDSYNNDKYNPLEDKKQNKKLKFWMYPQYNSYGKELRRINKQMDLNGNYKNILKYYNRKNNQPSSKLIVNKIKDILTEEE